MQFLEVLIAVADVWAKAPYLPPIIVTLLPRICLIFYNKQLNSTRVPICRHDLLDEGRSNDVAVNFFTSLLYETNRPHIAVLLFSNTSHKTSKCGENIRDTLP